MKFDNECCFESSTKTSDLAHAKKCPACDNEGITVSKITVEHLVADDCRKTVEGDGYRICMNEDCNVVYYNNDIGMKFLEDQVGVPIWFKKNANPKYACYCSKVTEEQVIEAVVKHGYIINEDY